MAGSWLDWLYGSATPGSGTAPQMSYDALGNPLPGAAAAPIGLPNTSMSGAPMPPGRPSGLNATGLPVPMPPQRPMGMNASGNGVPMPPQRPAGIVPQAPGLGAPAISYDALGNAIPGGLDLPGRGINVPLPPQRPASFDIPQVSPVAQGRPKAPQVSLPAANAVPASGGATMSPAIGAQSGPTPSGTGQGFEWVKTQDEMGRTVWTTRPLAQAQPAGINPGSTSTPTMFGANIPSAGSGLQAFLSGIGANQPSKAGAAPSVGPNGPQIPNATGLAGMLGAQPSMQAQNSTGPTAFLDQLFGFRG